MSGAASFQKEPLILVVANDLQSRGDMSRFLAGNGFTVLEADSCGEALALCAEGAPELILLDISTLGSDGFKVCARLSREFPVTPPPIILFVDAEDGQAQEKANQAGARTIIQKPVSWEGLNQKIRFLLKENHKTTENHEYPEKWDEAHFSIRSVEEARALAKKLAKLCPNPVTAAIGLAELLVNGVEHGCLGITYEEKTRLHEQNAWDTELERRFALPENSQKRVTIQMRRTPSEISFHIQDPGVGFDWKSYLKIDPGRVLHKHGRGIAVARSLSFDGMEYSESGNKVTAVIFLEDQPGAKERPTTP
ncbi:MAG: response regulator [Magnetococcales bacterium]|nr:response regulator [Magnetococcales bacterium]